LIAGRSGLAAPVLPSGMQVSTKLVGQVLDFDPALHVAPQQIGSLDRVSQFAVVAARQALAQSGVRWPTGLPNVPQSSSGLDRAATRQSMTASIAFTPKPLHVYTRLPFPRR